MGRLGEFLASLPDGFFELTQPWRDDNDMVLWAPVLWTLAGFVLIVLLGSLAWYLGRRSGLVRFAGVLCGLLALVVAVALPVWWVIGLGMDAAAVLLTGAGMALVAVLGALAYWLGTRPSMPARAVAGLFGLLAVAILGALVTWWTIGVGVASQVAMALWQFGGGFFGIVLMGGSAALIGLFCMLAYRLRGRQGWLSALFGAMAVLLGLWWLIGIVPSAWVYFVDSQKDLLRGQVIPGAITLGPLDVASNFYDVFRDTIVLVQGTVVLGIGVWLMLAVQKRFPGGLGEGEERGPTTGGYK